MAAYLWLKRISAAIGRESGISHSKKAA